MLKNLASRAAVLHPIIMFRLPLALIFLSVLSVYAQLPTGTETATPLNTAIVQAGKKYIGDMSDFPELNDDQYLEVVRTPGLFGQMTPGNSMKWVGTL